MGVNTRWPAFGAAGQRCMALSAVVTEGECGPFRAALQAAASALVLSPGAAPGVDVGPVISAHSAARLGAAVAAAAAEGAVVSVDGAGAVARLRAGAWGGATEGGFWVGPKSRAGSKLVTLLYFLLLGPSQRPF